MKNEVSEILLEKVLKQLESGYSPEEVLSQCPEYASKLKPFLEIAKILYAMPKKQVPEPFMQRKYILAPARKLWVHWIRISRFAMVSMSTLLLLGLVGGTGYAAQNSLPGETLFQVKKAAEHLQLQLATDPKEKLSLQIEIAQKRLTEAQKILNSNSKDPQKEQAALKELAKETSNTISALSTTVTDKSAPLSPTQTSSLQDMAAKQQDLIQKIASQDSPANKNVLDASQENATTVAQLQKYISIASNEQALAKLPSNPAAITATGTISSINNNSITVGQNKFIINEQTIIKDIGKNPIKTSDLSADEQLVEVLGDKTESGLLARQITVMPKAQPGSGLVKGTQTQQPATSTKLTSKATTLPSRTGEPMEEAAPDPNIAIGSFIIENPAPQTDFAN